ncbi:outer membrane protein assembly factor BamB family protein [Geodermatophilus sp. SYSU D00815]
MPGLRRPPLRVWVWTAATLALVVVATLLWRGSDAAATDRSTAPQAAVPSGTPAAEPAQAWSVPAGPVPEEAVESHRVVVGDRHGVTALDPATGEPVWHYTRSNARLCDVTATDGVVVAVFRTEVRCDEAVALRADTGVYAWTRNVSFDSDVTLSSRSGLVLATSRGSVVVIDPIGDNIRWRYTPDDCLIDGAVPGSSGVAVLLRCEGVAGLRVRLIDSGQGSAVWTRDLPAGDGPEPALAGADWGVTVVVGDELQLLAAADGAVVTTAPLPAAGDDEPPPRATDVGAVVLVWARGTLTALESNAGTVLWQQPAVGLPTAEPLLKVGVPASALYVPEEGGFVQRDPATGAELGRAAVDGLPAGGVSTVVGDVVVYRLADEVRGYR